MQEALEAIGAPWPLICPGCWSDISREGAQMCCQSFRCVECHLQHQREDDDLIAFLGLED